MNPNYELWLTDDHGLRIALLDNMLALTCSRVTNAIGWCAIDLPTDFDTSLVAPDRMLQVWRQPSGGALSLWRTYFLRRWSWQTRGGEETLLLEGPDTNDLLRRRIVAHYNGSTEAAQTDYADDMMKTYVTDAIADGTNPVPTAGTRVWADLSVAANLGDGPTLTRGANWGRLLLASGGGLLVDIGNAAREAGTEVFFDVVPDAVGGNSITFQFRTYTGQPGMDVSDRVVFDQERGNLVDPFLEYDYSEEINYVYAGGQGEGEARNVQQVYDTDRYNASQWNRCEAFADARNQTTDNGVREAGRALMREGRPRRRAGGIPLDTQGTRFGVDWDFGYKVKDRYRGLEFDSIVRSVVLRVDGDGEETIQARLEYED